MKYLILFLLSYSLNIKANDKQVENNFRIEAGLNVSRMLFFTGLIKGIDHDDDDDRNELENESTGFGLSTYAGYRFTNWETSIGSDIIFGKLEDIAFNLDKGPVSGDGSFRIFSITPLLRYYTTKSFQIPYTTTNKWNIYLSAGPTWSLHTFTLSENQTDDDFSDTKRINFENRGGSLNIGIEEVVPFKQMHPAFIEMGYSYMRSYQIYIVDASDFKEVKTLSKKDSKDFYGHYFTLRFGITIF